LQAIIKTIKANKLNLARKEKNQCEVEKNELFVCLKAHQPQMMPIMPAITSNDGGRTPRMTGMLMNLLRCI